MLLLLLAVVLWVVAVWALSSWVRHLPEPPERFGILTEDGWRLTLHHQPPPPGVTKRPVPVILGHGLVMDRHCWSLGPGVSMPAALAARGHDVWLAEYRGTPSSRPPEGAPRSWDLSDHAQRDLPAIIDALRLPTGAPRVSWVGHSMGGMVLYLYAHAHGDQALERVVTLASPVALAPASAPLVARWEGRLVVLAQQLPRVPMRLLVRLIAPLTPLLPAGAHATFFKRSNLRPKEVMALLLRGVQDTSPRLLGDFVEMRAERRLLSPPPPRAGDNLFAALTRPLLVVATRSDGLAPPGSVRPAFDLAGSPTRAWLLCGDPERPSGPRDFGHSDLISSEGAMIDVAPVVARWLEEARCPQAQVQRSDSPEV